MVTAGQTSLEITEYGIDPLEFGHVLRLAPGDHRRPVRTIRCDHSTETGQAIGQDSASGSELVFGPFSDRLESKAWHGGELGAQRMSVIGERDGGDEWHLVLRTASNLTAATLTTKVSIVDLNLTIKDITRFSRHHCLHQLMVNEPCGRVAHSQMPHQCQRGQACLGLADQVDRQEPHRQREFRTLEYRTGDKRGLMSAGVALKDFVGATTQYTMRSLTTAGTTKSVRPACPFQRHLTSRLGSVKFEKLRHRQARLKLDSIHRHVSVLPNDLEFRVRPVVAHHVSLADDHC